MGTHVLDAPYQAMDMWKVEPSRVNVREVKWGCPGAWQARATMDFTIPARDGWEVCSWAALFAYVEQYEVTGHDARTSNAASSNKFAHNDWTLGGVGLRMRF